MRFFHDDHQRARLLAFPRVEVFSFRFPMVANFAGNQIGDQQIVQLVVVFAKREDDVPAVLKVFDDIVQAFGAGGGRQVGFVLQAPQFLVQS